MQSNYISDCIRRIGFTAHSQARASNTQECKFTERPEDQRGRKNSDERKHGGGNIHRADGVNRFGICQQQFGADCGLARFDRTSAFGSDAGVERAWRSAERAAQAGDLGQEVGYTGSHRLSRGRKEIQVPQASPAHAVQYDAGAVSRKMGVAAGLSHGCPELRGRALSSCETDGAGPAPPAAQVAGSAAASYLARRRASPLAAYALASAARASARMRSTIERKPFERWGVRCSRRPSRSNSAIASADRISWAGLPENIANRMAMSPRTI